MVQCILCVLIRKDHDETDAETSEEKVCSNVSVCLSLSLSVSLCVALSLYLSYIQHKILICRDSHHDVDHVCL